MIDNKPTDEFLEKLIADRVYPMDNGGYVKVGDDLVALARELQEYRNAQQVVPSKPTESDIPSWLNGEKRLHWLSGAEWMHNTFCAAMQSGAVKDGMAALELARGMANDPIAGAMSLVPADRKQDLI
ncbi:hypothetical protein [Lelliottia wanjuensis]|uniref:Uncharacterized protein n=1 Tax=Lelliottia wanjuensis TaxID=3050585 RepID=A0AAP4D336_9ENTR|nr:MULTISPECIES: hypothetical protein [unclassified Lelliottia]MDK9364194.1 hypothetical protein [Lelliottia sp. V106_12]MDK9617129.1 hypothetical protein [Lelliottia sp. V106_9]